MRRALLVLGSWIACGAWLAAAPAPRPAEDRPGALVSLAVPGGVDALAAAAGLPVPAPAGHRRARADPPPSFRVRRRPGRRGPPAGGGCRPGPPAAAAAGDDDSAAVRRGSVDPRDLPSHGDARRPRRGDPDQAAGRVVLLRRGRPRRRDPRLVPRPPHRLLRISAQAGAFAAFGPSLRVRGERVASPGGPAADPLWKALVDASPANADLFVDKLLGARAGRLAWLYDTVSRLDAGAQRHLLEGDGALDRMRRLADVFARVNPEWRIEDRPLWRPLVDPATLLLELEARLDGSPILPEPAAWAGTFGRPEQVDAAWLVDRVFSGDGAALRDRFDLALFAMRWTRDGREPASRGALDLFVEAPALALTLERIGVRDNAVAMRLHGLLQRPDVREDAQAMRLLQASLALIERPALAGSFDASVAGGLLAALVDRVEADGAGARRAGLGQLAPWRRRASRSRPRRPWTGSSPPRSRGRRRPLPSGSNGKGSAISSIARRRPGPGSSACTRRRAGRRWTPRSATRQRCPTRWSR